MNSKPYTIWTNQPVDLKSGRWVQKGKASRLNWLLTGLPGGKFYVQRKWPWVRYESCDIAFQDHMTVWIDSERVRWPRGFGVDGWIKGLLGQRQIR